jgi:hypothetical protein
MNYNDFKTMAHEFFALAKTMTKPQQMRHSGGIAGNLRKRRGYASIRHATTF